MHYYQETWSVEGGTFSGIWNFLEEVDLNQYGSVIIKFYDWMHSDGIDVLFSDGTSKTIELPIMKVIRRDDCLHASAGARCRCFIDIYLLDPFDANKFAERGEFSIRIQRDGSANGTMEGRKLLDFLMAWNAQPIKFLNEIKKFSASCFYCKKRLSKLKSRHDCAEEWGLTRDELELESVDAVQSVETVPEHDLLVFVTSDGERIMVARDADLVKKSQLIQDLLLDFEVGNATKVSEIPVAIPACTLKAALEWTADLTSDVFMMNEHTPNYDEDIVHKFVEILKAFDYLCVETESNMYQSYTSFLVRSIVYSLSEKLVHDQ